MTRETLPRFRLQGSMGGNPRDPYPGWDPDPLDATPPDPEPPRRLGCSVLVLALLVLLSSGTNPVASSGLVATRQGTWAYASPSYGPRYLAIPEGPGWLVEVCGPAACLERVSTDAGPELWLQRAGRIGDLSSAMFLEVCGPLSAGLCRGSYTITGRADQSGEDPPPHPADDRMRQEDGGPVPTLPPTDTQEMP